MIFSCPGSQEQSRVSAAVAASRGKSESFVLARLWGRRLNWFGQSSRQREPTTGDRVTERCPGPSTKDQSDPRLVRIRVLRVSLDMAWHLDEVSVNLSRVGGPSISSCVGSAKLLFWPSKCRRVIPFINKTLILLGTVTKKRHTK